MYTIDTFIKNTFFLTNSLVIKISDIAEVVNKGIYINTGEVPSTDKREWKYYLNLYGEKHKTNSNVLVYVLEIDQIRELSKDLLIKYPYTRKELSKHQNTYKELIDKYPRDIDFIKGCLYPVDPVTAINAKDGSILGYNKSMIETQELSLVRELETEIFGFLTRWHVKNYIITDELYMASLIGVLYSMIPSTIINLRSKRIYSAEAHSFHLEHFFRSRLDIWDEVSELNNETIYWLYQNLNYLMKNTGKNSTLKTIAEKIFQTNNIGVGTFEIEKGQPVLVESSDINKSGIKNLESRFIAKKLNSKYEISKNKFMDTESILNMELFDNPDLDTSIDENALKSFTIENSNKINRTSSVVQDTKLLDIDSSKLYKIFGNDPLVSILDNWLYFSITKKYTNKTMFIDPNTKHTYPLTPMEGLYFFYYILTELAGVPDLKVRKLNYGYVVNNEVTIEELTKDLYNIIPAKNIATMILNKIPDKIGIINRAEDFKNYLAQLKDFYMKVWIYDSNINNGAISANIKHMVARMYLHGSLYLTKKRDEVSFKELLSNIGVHIEITSEYNKLETLNALFTTFAGVNISDNIKVKEKIDLYTKLLLKLTSYSTQVIKTIDDNKTLYTPYSTIEPFYSDQGLINITKAEVISPYETNKIPLKCTGNDFRDLLVSGIISSIPKIAYCNKRKGLLTIITEQSLELEGSIVTPDTWAEILDPCYDEFVAEIISEANNYDADIVRGVNTTTTLPSFIKANERRGILKTPKKQTLELEGKVTQLTTYTEIESKNYDEYTPALDVESIQIDLDITPGDVYLQNNFDGIKEIKNNKLVTYTDELFINDIVGIETTPNLIVEIDDDTID